MEKNYNEKKKTYMYCRRDVLNGNLWIFWQFPLMGITCTNLQKEHFFVLNH